MRTSNTCWQGLGFRLSTPEKGIIQGIMDPLAGVVYLFLLRGGGGDAPKPKALSS